jgi:hypothetical protein
MAHLSFRNLFLSGSERKRAVNFAGGGVNS